MMMMFCMESIGIVVIPWLIFAVVSAGLINVVLCIVTPPARIDPHRGLRYETCLLALIVSTIPLFIYGATAMDTIGGLNAIATAWAGFLGIVITCLAGGSRRESMTFPVIAGLAGIAIVLLSVFMFMRKAATGGFGVGYGP